MSSAEMSDAPENCPGTGIVSDFRRAENKLWKSEEIPLRL